MTSGEMLPLDDLAEVASALSRTHLDTFLAVDRRHQSLVQSHFDGKGPWRIVSLARATGKKLCISCFDDEHRWLVNLQQFCRSLRNCYVSSLRLDGHLFGPKDLTELMAIRGDYVVYQAHISSEDASEAMQLLEAIPQCTSLKWECPLTSDFFSHASIRSVRYLNLVDVENNDLNALVEWLHSTLEEGGGRRLIIRQDCFDEMDALYKLKNAFLADTHSSEYQLLVYGDYMNPGGVCDEALANAVGDLLEVEAEDHGRSFLCVTRLSKLSAERTSIVVSTDGPKVWDFGTIRDLDIHLVNNGIVELLSRSGLIANEMDCECGEPMYLRLCVPTQCNADDRSIDDYAWKCSGERRGQCDRQYGVELDDDSPMKVFNRLAECKLILKAIMLLCSGKTNEEIHVELRVVVSLSIRLRVIYERVTCRSVPYSLRGRDGEAETLRRLKEFYENMKLEYHRERPCKAANFILEQ